MTTSTTTRALTVGGALVLAASGVLGSGVADAGGGIATCAPTTRTLDTLTYTTPIALGPRGHVVADEANPGASSGLWLHRPNGTKTAISFADGSRPEWPSDVSARGLTVGTEGVRYTPIEPVLAWASQGGDAALLPMPTRVEPSYAAYSVNADGAVAGVVTNYRYSQPGQTDFTATPILWPTTGSDPQELAMPNGAFEVAFDNNKPMISIRRDGMVSAVLDDYNSPASYLARWRPGATAPMLDLLPADSDPVAVAGRWVVGRPFIAGTTVVGDMSVWSPTSEIRLSEPLGRFGHMGVAADGTYFGTVTVQGTGGASSIHSVVGRGTTQPREVGNLGIALDVAGTSSGLLLVNSPSATNVVSCALSLPEATDVVVTDAAP